MKRIAWTLAFALVGAAGLTRTSLAESHISEDRIRALIRRELGERDRESFLRRVDLSLGVTGVFQGTSGADPVTSPKGNTSAASFSADLEAEASFTPRWKSFLHMETGSGAGIDQYAGSLVGFNQDADDDETLRITEAWVEGTRALTPRYGAGLSFGKIDPTVSFDTNEIANDEGSQFLNAGFKTNPTIPFPDNDFGSVGTVAMGEALALSVGFMDADSVDDRGGRLFDDAFYMGQASVKVAPGGLAGNYRAFAWRSDVKTAGILGAPASRPRDGWGLSFDQQVGGGVAVFARYGTADGIRFEIEHWISAGAQVSGSRWGRADDRLGLAYGLGLLGADFKSSLAGAGTPAANVHHAEVYYAYKVNDYMEVSPSVQMAGHPGGMRDANALAAFGTRVQLSF